MANNDGGNAGAGNNFSFSQLVPDPGGLANYATSSAMGQFTDLNGWSLLALSFATMVVRRFGKK